MKEKQDIVRNSCFDDKFGGIWSTLSTGPSTHALMVYPKVLLPPDFIIRAAVPDNQF